MKTSWTVAVVGILAMLLAALPATAERRLLSGLEEREEHYAHMARQIWEWAEVGYQETRSSNLLQAELAAAGFHVEAGVAGMPTAFVASYGEGRPVIGILAEFDALPGISQTAMPERQVREGARAGHACGHHLFGTAAVAAAIAVRDWLDQARPGRQGSIRLYGSPAEEGGSGKVYLVRAGLFDDVDAVLHWHPADRNAAGPATSLANKSARFTFHGVSSHAASAPERGRSALDGVEAMNYMTNLLREHVPETTRIHYVITRGGEAPNVVPDLSQVYYYVRHPDAASLQSIWARVEAAAQGAASGTGTEVSIEVMHGNHSLLPNQMLARVMDKNLRRVGGLRYSATEQAFAERIRQTLPEEALSLGSELVVQEFRTTHGKGSTDVGDVSWVVPTAGMQVATWVPGTAAHSWQAIAAGGTSIGAKGMMVAAKTLALTAVDLLKARSLLKSAREELERRRGPDWSYQALLGDRNPPLDYRNNSGF